ncbi:UNVERIFIED_ORG: hypothetical protein M2442_000887 [Methylorubrum zatmanii]|nr:hypothetical protein [Methylorubrum zatmanii]
MRPETAAMPSRPDSGQGVTPRRPREGCRASAARRARDRRAGRLRRVPAASAAPPQRRSRCSAARCAPARSPARPRFRCPRNRRVGSRASARRRGPHPAARSCRVGRRCGAGAAAASAATLARAACRSGRSNGPATFFGQGATGRGGGRTGGRWWIPGRTTSHVPATGPTHRPALHQAWPSDLAMPSSGAFPAVLRGQFRHCATGASPCSAAAAGAGLRRRTAGFGRAEAPARVTSMS